ncbi:helix-turn-helix domain-containing protein [Streptomyces sp. NPDC101118]|uniref:helix-turn-helix domain-containing protein n=1 Tax=Streptomyces sp. NPDC101118 TaxID=3366109 RepID=UPI0037F9E5A8
MPEIDRSPANSSAVERGEVPEVVELGKVLTELFKTLGVSQEAYAVRVSLDASAVSRYLRGRRVATEDFVDRLVREVGRKAGTPVQEEAREHIHTVRLAALRATDPDRFALEDLRREAERTQRTVGRLLRDREALHDLLEKREAEKAALQAEMSRMRRDWAGDRAEAGRHELVLRTALADRNSAYEELLLEIEALRADLAATDALKDRAESRYRDLEQQLLVREEELATLRAGHGDDAELPVDALIARLGGFDEIVEPRRLTRALDTVVWDRPIEDVVQVVDWLLDTGAGTKVERLVADVAELRPPEDVADLGAALAARAREVGRFELFDLHERLVVTAARLRTSAELAGLFRRWRGVELMGDDTADLMLRHALGEQARADVAELLFLLDDPEVAESVLVARMRNSVESGRGLRVLVDLARRNEALAAPALLWLVVTVGRESDVARNFGNGFGDLPQLYRGELADRILAMPPGPVTRLLTVLYMSTRFSYAADELARRAAADGRLGALSEYVFDEVSGTRPTTPAGLADALLAYAQLGSRDFWRHDAQ